jgi:hypothetical protein
MLPLVPAVLLVAAPLLGRSRSARAALWASTLALGSFAWAGTADYLGASAAAWRLGERAVAAGFAPQEVKASVEWCYARQWPQAAERAKSAGATDLTRLPLSCLTAPRALVSLNAAPRSARAPLDVESYFSPLRLRRVGLFLYRYP